MENEEKQNLNEKEVLAILDAFEREFNERFQSEDRELQKVKFYENFEIKGIRDAEISGVFVTEELDADGNKIYHLYYGDPSNEILSVDAEGQVQVSEKWKEVLGDVDLEKTLEINDREEGRLKGISEKAKPEEMQQVLKDSSKKEQDKEKNGEKEDAEQIEQDLQEQDEDLEITEFTKIKDSYIHEKMPDVFKPGQESGIAYSNKLNSYVIVSKENGRYQINDNVKPAQMTWRTIISINENGEKVERKIPYAIMELPGNDEQEIAVTMNDKKENNLGKEVDIETVTVTPCQERVSRAVRTGHEGIEGEQTYKMRTEAETQGVHHEDNIAHGVKKAEDAEREQGKSVDYERTENDYIPNTQKTWKELMDETGETLPKLLERYDNEMKEQGITSEDAVQTIEDDYGRLPGQRQKGTN